MYDIVIIGAGIMGCFLAHRLSAYDCRIAVIDRESDVANGVTMANSAIIHAGEDPEDGTLKAKFNVRGSRMYEEICKKLQVGYHRTSAYIAATDPAEEASLNILYGRAKDRKIPARLIEGDEARHAEPALSPRVQRVLELPTTAVIYPWEVAIALAEEAVQNGCDLFLEEEVTGIRPCFLAGKAGEGENRYYLIETNRRIFKTRMVINAAGLYADEISRMATGKRLFSIRPRKGEYYVLDRSEEPLVHRVIYPVPSDKGKGVLAVPTVHGNVLLGPNSVFTDDREDIATTSGGLAEVKRELEKTLIGFPGDRIIRTFSGLRPTGDTGDFIIGPAACAPGFYNVACIESPGLSSAPAIAQYVTDELILPHTAFKKKADYRRRTPILSVKDLPIEEQNALVKRNAAYGRIVCRCEQVTEGEVIDAICRPVGARSIKAVKKRVRPGMGRCQGGFCEPRVAEILSRECGIDPLALRFDKGASYLFAEETKDAKDAKDRQDGRSESRQDRRSS